MQRMPCYKSHKTVHAVKIKAIDLAFKDGVEMGLVTITPDEPGAPRFPVPKAYYEKHDPQVGGYYVRYEDGYESFSPAEAFESGYTRIQEPTGDLDAPPPVCGYTFSQALDILKSGGKVARIGWNGKGLFAFMVPGSTFRVNRPPLLGIYPEGQEINYRPHLDLKAVDGTIGVWVPSTSDLLAEDWFVVG